MASCNKTVVDYGTYSAWAAALAGGEAIIPDLSKDKPWPIKKIVLSQKNRLLPYHMKNR